MGLIDTRPSPLRCILNETMCEASHAQVLIKLQPIVTEHFNLLGGVLLVSFLALLLLAKASDGPDTFSPHACTARVVTRGARSTLFTSSFPMWSVGPMRPLSVGPMRPLMRPVTAINSVACCHAPHRDPDGLTPEILPPHIPAQLTWKVSKVFTKADLKKLGEYKLLVVKIAEQEKGLYDEYFKSLSHDHAEER